MDMQEFIAEIRERNFGVVSFNTYIHDGINHCFIMVAEKGSEGKFFKEECVDNRLNETLQKIIIDVEKWRNYITGARNDWIYNSG